MTSSDNTPRMTAADTEEPPLHRTGAIRSAAALLGGLAVTLALTPVLCVLPAGAGLVGPLWLLAILWTVLESLAQAMWQGVSRNDWPAFAACDCRAKDDDFYFFTRSGRYVDLAIGYRDEALMRDPDRYLKNDDQHRSHL